METTKDETKKHVNNFFDKLSNIFDSAKAEFEKVMDGEEIEYFKNLMKTKAENIEKKMDGFYESSKDKFHEFIKNIETENEQTKAAFKLLVEAAFDGKELTDAEKEQIGNQLKDVLKTVGLVGLVALPGGTLFFILLHFLKLSDYVTPSAFKKDDKKKEETATK